MTAKRTAALALSVWLCACAPAATTPPLTNVSNTKSSIAWSSPLLRDHPLVGEIIEVRTGRAASEDTLVRAIRGARYVLLGEQHDNADHHALQARLVEAALGGKHKPIVAFEMFDISDQPAIDAHFAQQGSDWQGLAAAVNWENKGWPSWSMYAPIVRAAVAANTKVVGANLPRAQVMKAAKSGQVDGRPLPELPPHELEAMKAELFEAHCGHIPKEMMAPMALAQIARDTMLAHRVVEGDRGGGAILIAGNGHVRKDRGVPWHLRARGGLGGIIAIGLIEVREGAHDPMRYGEQGAPPFDFVWFTPSADRDDPCAHWKQ